MGQILSKPDMEIGAHVSIAGGIDKAIERGIDIGATAIQTFASSPRTLHMPYPSKEAIESYTQKRAQSPIRYHVFHGIYLINLAHERVEYVQVCIQALCQYQRLAADIGAAGTVFHLGSHKGAGFTTVLTRVIQALGVILSNMPAGVDLILENAAGQKGTLGVSIEELATLIDGVAKTGTDTSRLRIAIDTQHAFASGYPIHTPEGLASMIAKIDALIGLNKLAFLHVNDSLVPYCSYRDRHANLGEGHIGLEALRHIIQHPALSGKPLLLEVPGIDKKGPGKKDVDVLKTLLATT